VPKQKTNQYIRAKEVRVVNDKKEMLGVMKIEEALSMAKEQGLDLVEISPNAKPPVCKIIDFGKFRYEEKKKEKQQKLASKGHEMKGIRLSFRISGGDLERQMKKAEEFLITQHPVRIQMMIKGRERAHMDLAYKKLYEFIDSLKEIGTLEQKPRGAGFQLIAILKPKTKAEQVSQ